MARGYLQIAQYHLDAALGKEYIYIAGGTNLATVYDPVSGDAISNPVSIAADGYVQAFVVDDSTLFDLRVVAFNGTTMFTRQNVSVLGGTSGVPGPQGPQGVKGDKGDKGDTGASGQDGADGANGTNGTDGEDGVSLLTIRINETTETGRVEYNKSDAPDTWLVAGDLMPDGIGQVKLYAEDSLGYLADKLEAGAGISIGQPNSNSILTIENSAPETYKTQAQETSSFQGFLNQLLVAGPNTTIQPSTDGNSLIISAGGLDAGFNPRGAWVSGTTYNECDGVWYYDASVTPVVNRYYIATATTSTNPYTDGTGWVIMFSIDQQGDMLAKLDAADPVTGYLLSKFEAGTGLVFTRVNDVAGDKIVISASGGAVTGTPFKLAMYDNTGLLGPQADLTYDIRDNLSMGASITMTANAAASTSIGHGNSVDTNDAFVIGTASTALGGGSLGVAYTFGSGNNASAPYGMAIGYDVDAGISTAGETVGVGTHISVDGSEAIAFGQHQDVNGAAFVSVGRNITDDSLSDIVVSANGATNVQSGFTNARYVAGAHLYGDSVTAVSRPWTAVFGATSDYIGFFGKYADQNGVVGPHGSFLGFDANNFLVVSNDLSHADFDTTPASTADRAGRLVWDADYHTLSLGLEGGSALQLGQEELVYAVNRTGSTISNGQVVYISGSQGNRVVVSLAQAITTPSNQVALAVATQDILDNQTGYFTRFGLVSNIDTSAWVEGTILYVSTTAGSMTGTAPAKPYSQLAVGVVTRQHATVGSILVSPYVVPRLGQLTDVSTTGATEGQALVYDATTGIWKPGSTAASDGKVAVQAGDTPDYLTNQVSSSDGSIGVAIVDGKLDLTVETLPETAATAFRATALEATPNTLVSGRVPFAAMDFNEGGWTLDDTTKTFVAPQAGTYLVSGGMTVNGRTTEAQDFGFMHKATKTLSTSLTVDWTRVFGDPDYLGNSFRVITPVSSRVQLNYGFSMASISGATGDASFDLYWNLFDAGGHLKTSSSTIKPKSCSVTYDHQNAGEYLSSSSSDVVDVTVGDYFVFNIQGAGATYGTCVMNLYVSGDYFKKDVRVDYQNPTARLEVYDSTLTTTKTSLSAYGYIDEISNGATNFRSTLVQMAAGDRLALTIPAFGTGVVYQLCNLCAALINPVISGGGGSGGDGKVMVDSTDTAEYLSDKLIAGTNTTLTETTNDLGFKALQINLDIPEGHTLYAGKCRRYQKQISIPTSGSQPTGLFYVVGKTADDWAFGSGEVYDYCDGAFTGGYDATTGYFSFPREGLFNVEFSGSAFLYSGSSVPVYFNVVITSSYDNFVTATIENAYQITIDELMSYQDHMTNFSIPALVNNVADGQGRYKKIRVSVTVAPFVSPYNVTCTFRHTYVSINEVANPQAVQGPKGDKGDPGTAGEATLDGLLTFPIILSNTNISTGHTSDQGATYASSRVIPAASVEAKYMSCFFTQVGTFYGLRMGIYTPGPAGDTLIAQTEVCTNTPSLGICTMPLTRDGAGNLLTEKLYLDPNTSYMPAVVLKANATNMAAYEGISTNPPNHFGRYDSWNAPAPTNLMPSTASFSQSNTFPWLAISK